MAIKEKFKLGIYNVGIIKQDVSDLLEHKDYKIVWMKHNYKDRFFADPFLLYEDEMFYYILVEEFCFYENIGKISLLHVGKNDFRLGKKEILIQEEYHMSFPYCDEKWIYPEGYRSGAHYKYEIDNILNKQKICDEGLIDAVPIRINGKEWMLAMTADNPLKHLYLMKKNSKNMYERVNEFPVKQDINCSRPAGQAFERDGACYRPVQDSEEMYGKKTHIMKVKTIDENSIDEEKVLTIASDNFPPYNQGLHTFNVYSGFVIVDGYYEKNSYIRKIFYVKLPGLVKRWNKIIGKE